MGSGDGLDQDGRDTERERDGICITFIAATHCKSPRFKQEEGGSDGWFWGR
jgi:hypothetical protein